MISIVVPVYKSEKTLERCVQSLLSQTEKELEIILVEDGSPDVCPDLCDRLAAEHARVRTIHQENTGVSAARNAGIRAAKGEYVAFVDSDDYVEPDYCARMREALEQEDAALALCGFHHHYVGADTVKTPGREPDLLRLYERGFLNMPWNKLFRRERLGQFPENLNLGEDLLFNLEYLKKGGKLALVDAPLYHYIQEESGESLSGKKRKDWLTLAGRIRREVGTFFLQRAKEESSGGANGTDIEAAGAGFDRAAVYRVVNTRFLCECLDRIEALPLDRELTGAEKRAGIRRLCGDKTVKKACRTARPEQLDYRILQWTLAHGLVSATYFLSVLRSGVVRAARKSRGFFR